MDREKAFRNYRLSTNRYTGKEEPEVKKRTEEEERVWQERIRIRSKKADEWWDAIE